jgi:hypothetical protein
LVNYGHTGELKGKGAAGVIFKRPRRRLMPGGKSPNWLLLSTAGGLRFAQGCLSSRPISAEDRRTGGPHKLLSFPFRGVAKPGCLSPVNALAHPPGVRLESPRAGLQAAQPWNVQPGDSRRRARVDMLSQNSIEAAGTLGTARIPAASPGSRPVLLPIRVGPVGTYRPFAHRDRIRCSDARRTLVLPGPGRRQGESAQKFSGCGLCRLSAGMDLL